MATLVPHHPLRLALARTLAWALLIGGWLLLGDAGQRHLPLWAGGLAPLALWLAGIGALRVLLRRRTLSPRGLRVGLLLSGVALAVCWRPGLVAVPIGVWLAAAAWACLVVAASSVVRTLRHTTATRPPAPLVPAAAGALLAWGLASGLEASGVAAAVAGGALVLALLLPGGGAVPTTCRASLFDCTPPLPDPAPWRRLSDWPRQAALLTMLPMMAMLPAMTNWCRSDWGLTPATGMLWHLATMLLPGLLARRWLAQADETALRRTLGWLMLASGAALWLRPGLGGLMAAALLQAGAWSLAWAWPLLQRPAAATNGQRSRPRTRPWQLLVVPAAVLALGAATAVHGPDALRATQALLAALASAGAACDLLVRLAISPASE